METCSDVAQWPVFEIISMAQFKTKLSIRQIRRLTITCGLLGFAGCLTVAATFFVRPAKPSVATRTPLRVNKNVQPTADPKPKELSLSDFRSIVNVRLQGPPKAKPTATVKPAKVIPRPVANIQLLGVFLDGSKGSFGVFQANGKEKVVKLGETVGRKGPLLTEVASDYVLVKYDQQPPQKIKLPSKKP